MSLTLLMQVVGIYDEACEVLFDEVFPGGSDLQGRWLTRPSSHASTYACYRCFAICKPPNARSLTAWCAPGVAAREAPLCRAASW